MIFEQDIPPMDLITMIALIVGVFLFLIVVMGIVYVMLVTGTLSSSFVNSIGMG